MRKEQFAPDEIRLLRKKLGENRVEFGKRLGVTHHAIQVYEQGNPPKFGGPVHKLLEIIESRVTRK